MRLLPLPQRGREQRRRHTLIPRLLPLLPLLNVPHRGTAPVTHPPFPGDFVHNWASPTRAAISRRTRSEIDDASIFSMTAARWLSTVRWLISRRAAITLLGWPATTRSST